MNKSDNNNWKSSNKAILIACFLLLAICEIVFFRNILLSDKLIGESEDGRLTMLITEHWLHVFKGEANVTDLGIFYPAENTLGYSDMLFGFGVIHSVLRCLSIEMHSAYKTTLILIHVFGTASCFWCLNQSLKLHPTWSLFGTIGFSFSPALSVNCRHTQLFALSLVPLAIIFAINFFRSIENRNKRAIWISLTILQLEFILYTAWYIAFFCALFTITFFLTWVAVGTIKRTHPGKDILYFIQLLRFDLPVYLLLFILLTIPFVKIELPLMSLSTSKYDAIKNLYLPEAIDLINVTSDNLLLGEFIKKLNLGDRSLTEEVNEGFSVVMLAVFAFQQFQVTGKIRGDRRFFLTRVLSITVIVSFLMIVRLSSNGNSFWRIVYCIFPGAKSVRAVARYMLFLSLPLSFSCALAGNMVGQSRARFASSGETDLFKLVCSTLLVSALILSNIQKSGVSSFWNSRDSVKMLENISAPPEECGVFFLSHSTIDERPSVKQLDAYQIADHFGIQTINGYSGVFPADWSGLWNIDGSNYENAVADWMMDNDLRTIYEYNQAENEWILKEPTDLMKRCFDAAGGIIPGVSGIWDLNPTADYSWTKKDVAVAICDGSIKENGLMLKVGMPLDWYLAQNPEIIPECSIYVNDEFLADIPVVNGVKSYHWEIKPHEQDIYTIRIMTNCSFVPADLGINNDGRELPMRLYYLGTPDGDL